MTGGGEAPHQSTAARCMEWAVNCEGCMFGPVRVRRPRRRCSARRNGRDGVRARRLTSEVRIGDVVQLTEPPMPQLATGLCAATAWRIARAPRVATLQTIACVSRVWGPAGARPSHWLRGQLTATKRRPRRRFSARHNGLTSEVRIGDVVQLTDCIAFWHSASLRDSGALKALNGARPAVPPGFSVRQEGPGL